MMKINRQIVVSFFFALSFAWQVSYAQTTKEAKVELGSQTAKNGFKNEDEIRAKFNNWKTDEEARIWLGAMNYQLAEIESVTASKPHGQKADIELLIKTKTAEKREGISIKLVSSSQGFNQIDKRWLATYAKMWNMPPAVHDALKLYVGEVPPIKPSKDPKRMYLNELDVETQKAVIDFFTANKEAIVSDIFSGDGAHTAGWMMVALKSSDKPRWVLRTDAYAIKFFGEGKVDLTRNGNLKIGRITVQRKGGDGGRETAKMLQFKINPALLFEGK